MTALVKIKIHRIYVLVLDSQKRRYIRILPREAINHGLPELLTMIDEGKSSGVGDRKSRQI